MAITATQFLEARLKAETDWQDSQAIKSRGYMPSMNTVLAILGQSTANFAPLKDRNNCGKVKVTWENACPAEATIVTNIAKVNALLCAPTGLGQSTTVAEYGITKLLKSPGFYILDDSCENAYSLVELTARNLITDQRAMVEKLDKFLVAQLVVFSGANAYLGDGMITQATGNLNKFSSFDAVAETFVPYMLRAAEYNNMTSPFFLQGDMLRNNKYVDEKQSGTAADQGYAKMWGDLATTEDFKGFAALSMTPDGFLIDRGSTAFVTKNAGNVVETQLVADYYLTSIPLMGGTIRDRNGEPIMVDIFRKRELVTVETVGGGTRCVLADTYQQEMKMDFLLNPTACNAGFTGIIHYQKDASLAPVGVTGTFTKVPQAAGTTYQAVGL